MAVFREVRRRAKQIAPQAIAICATAYFMYHAVVGDRGVMAWLRLEQELETAKAEQAVVEAKREEIERRVSLLGRDGVDPDLLEERARETLNYVRPDEVIIPLPEKLEKAD